MSQVRAQFGLETVNCPAELSRILDDFVDEDSSAFAAFRIDIQKRFENSFALTFPEDVHPTEFLSLINYLAYPIAFDLAGRSIIVAGKTTLNSDFDGLPKSLEGKRALLYLPEHDKDNDVVFLQTESGETLARSFNEGVWRKVKDSRLSGAVISLAETFGNNSSPGVLNISEPLTLPPSAS